MESKAILRNIRISPRKIRLVADLLRGKPVNQAMDILRDLSKGSARPLLKLLQSAVANVKQKMSTTEDKLKISSITVDMAPRLKRYKPKAMGKADTILKHASHIILTLQSTLEIKPEKRSKTEKSGKPAAAEAKKFDKHSKEAKQESK
ncbi:MAG: 50S ribosomal protein L22 [Candidatus Kerfeldbacteria bacterium CG08_land_8_20_14_0_20_43_14]|uniref:Large ribosomal subunit protein uL22 n=1 Tax=Candidatus Kerfeldbacteria bacterium CG08_land_8_20_14_0_20_43_14 TaxID=2014246 RepID=A0A2H0YPQ6_9BACT|nr:MAG: 50S ribosomal protein L22 [Candidatus Kerfeldbacteria bacterium CG08_land_8_20_14_0_20_43_14]